MGSKIISSARRKGSKEEKERGKGEEREGKWREVEGNERKRKLVRSFLVGKNFKWRFENESRLGASGSP